MRGIYSRELRIIAGLLAVMAFIQIGGAIRSAVHDARAQSTIQQVQICDPTASPVTCATVTGTNLNTKAN